jgi:phenylacetic acid degradation operon negative regulatory protein
VESALIRRRELRVPSARSLLLTVLGEYVLPAGEPVWTATLVSALGVLGVTEKAARQAIARSASDGWLASTRHGRRAQWELTEAGRRLLTEGAHRIYSFGQGRTGWDGRWLVLLTSAPQAGLDHRHRLRTRLTWAGFGALPGGVWVSTDPARENEANQILDELGLSGTCLSFVATSGGIGARQDLVARAWDLRAVQARYREFIGTFAPLDPANDRERMAAQTLLVHEWRKFPFLDPQLPRELLPAGWPGREAAALFAASHKRWQPGALRCWARLASPSPAVRAAG